MFAAVVEKQRVDPSEVWPEVSSFTAEDGRKGVDNARANLLERSQSTLDSSALVKNFSGWRRRGRVVVEKRGEVDGDLFESILERGVLKSRVNSRPKDVLVEHGKRDAEQQILQAICDRFGLKCRNWKLEFARHSTCHDKML